MAPYESLLWPSTMMLPFVKCYRVLRGIIAPPSPSVTPRPKILVIAGGEDRLMGVKLMRQMAAAYRVALAKENLKDPEAGAQFDVIEKSGHHVMLDCYWEKCAERVLRFVEEVDA